MNPTDLPLPLLSVSASIFSHGGAIAFPNDRGFRCRVPALLFPPLPVRPTPILSSRRIRCTVLAEKRGTRFGESVLIFPSGRSLEGCALAENISGDPVLALYSMILFMMHKGNERALTKVTYRPTCRHIATTIPGHRALMRPVHHIVHIMFIELNLRRRKLIRSAY